jgi:catecholate siderophore receptor
MSREGQLSSLRRPKQTLPALTWLNLIVTAVATQAADDNPAASNSASGSPSPSPIATSPEQPQNGADSGSPVQGDLTQVTVTGILSDDYHRTVSDNPKYPERLVDTPQTVTVIPESLIKDQNASTLQQALQNVPGITFTAGEGGTLPGDNFNIRGFNARDNIYVDGFRDTGVYNRDPFNLEQIEVVEGPASVYSGYGSTGGSVNLISKLPTSKPSFEADFGVGTNNYYRLTGDLNEPLPIPIPGSAFRVDAVYQYSEFADLDRIYNSHWGANPSLSLGLGTNTVLTLSYFFLEEQDLPTFGLPTINATAVAANPGLASHLNQVAPVDYSNFYGLVNRDYMNATTHIGTVTLQHTFDNGIRLLNTWRYGQTYTDEITTPPRFDTGLNYYPSGELAGNFTANNYPAGEMTRELRGRRQFDSILGDQLQLFSNFDTGKLHHDLVLDFEVSQQIENTRTASGLNVLTPLYDPNPLDPYPFPVAWGGVTRTRLNDYAAAIFDSIKLGRYWLLSGGLRYDHLDAVSQNPATTTASAYTARQSNDLLSWRAAITFKPAENGSIYFGYGTSYDPSIEGTTGNSSTPAGLTSSTANLSPERDEAYEIGTKWEFMKGKLALTSDVFRTYMENARISDPTLPSGSGVSVLDGKIRVQGFEVGAQGSITEAWKIFGGYTILSSRFLSGPSEGHQLPYTPNQSLSVWTTYQLPFHLTIGTGILYADKQFGSTANTTSVPGYWTQQAMVSYRVDQHLSFQLNIFNLWDRHYIATYGNGGAIPGAGRAFTFTSSIKF